MGTMRRHRPSWMTRFCAPTGTFVSVNFPSGPVTVLTIGLPVTSAPHWVHDTPAENGDGVVAGM